MTLNLSNSVNLQNKYILYKNTLLGQGASSNVYLAYDQLTKSNVAIKQISMNSINNQVTRYLLNNEKKAVTILNNHNILKTLDIIQQKDYCYIVSEYCNQGTLFQYINQRKKLKQSQAIQIFKGIINGYQECLKYGILHRDLKSSNILLHNGIPKITDFGYCDFNNQIKPSIQYNVGSVNYMAPQTYFNNNYSQKSDIWAIGMILYQMVVGSTIQQEKSAIQIFNKIRNYGIQIPQVISQFNKNLILKCLKFDQNKRISIEELKNILQMQKIQQKIYKRDIKSHNITQNNYQQNKLQAIGVFFVKEQALRKRNVLNNKIKISYSNNNAGYITQKKLYQRQNTSRNYQNQHISNPLRLSNLKNHKGNFQFTNRNNNDNQNINIKFNLIQNLFVKSKNQKNENRVNFTYQNSHFQKQIMARNESLPNILLYDSEKNNNYQKN